MAKTIYLSDEIKTKLDEVANIDKRSLVDEIDYLISCRLEIIESAQRANNGLNGLRGNH